MCTGQDIRLIFTGYVWNVLNVRGTNPVIKSVRHPIKKYAEGLLLERVGLDILGPLPECSLRNKYILVVSDYFLKWV